MYIVKLEKGVWVAPWSGDPGRTLVQENAQRFRKKHNAQQALTKSRKFRPFISAKVYNV